jgi:hypothetical protein
MIDDAPMAAVVVRRPSRWWVAVARNDDLTITVAAFNVEPASLRLRRIADPVAELLGLEPTPTMKRGGRYGRGSDTNLTPEVPICVAYGPGSVVVRAADLCGRSMLMGERKNRRPVGTNATRLDFV